MGIDWITFAAQIVNLLILVALLWRFLFKPVIRAMDRREEKIASRLEGADEKKREAEEEREKLRREREKLERHRQEERDRIRREAEEEKKGLLEQARKEAEESRSRWMRAVGEEKSGLLEDLRRRAGEGLCTSLRKSLHDLADEELEKQAVEVFLRRLSKREDFDEEEIEGLHGEDGGGLVVRTAWGLSEEERERVESGVKEGLGWEREIRFDTDSDLVCGVEVRTEGRRIGWSVRSYMEAFERSLLETLEKAEGSREGEGGEESGEAD